MVTESMRAIPEKKTWGGKMTLFSSPELKAHKVSF